MLTSCGYAQDFPDTLFNHTTDGKEVTIWVTSIKPISLSAIGVSQIVIFTEITKDVYTTKVNNWDYIIFVGDWSRPKKVETFNVGKNQ